MENKLKHYWQVVALILVALIIIAAVLGVIEINASYEPTFKR